MKGPALPWAIFWLYSTRNSHPPPQTVAPCRVVETDQVIQTSSVAVAVPVLFCKSFSHVLTILILAMRWEPGLNLVLLSAIRLHGGPFGRADRAGAPADLPTFCRFHQSLGWFQNVPYKSVESPQSQTTHWSSVPEIRNTRVSNENRRFMIKMIKDLTLSNIQHNQYCVSRTFVFMEAYLLGFSESCWAGRTAATSSKASKKPNLVYFKLAMDMFTRHARHCKTTVYNYINS